MRYDPDHALGALSAAASGRPAGRAYVVGQLGQSLDGRIATPTGKSKYISGAGALLHLHRLRANVDAVLVGVNTVIADDPQLTVRLCDGASPVRVVVDPSGRLPQHCRLLDDPAAPHTLLVRACDAARDPRVEEGRAGEIRLPRDAAGALAPRAIVDALYARGLGRILIEGGADTLSRALDAGVLDQLHVMVAPVILGSGTPGLALPPIDELSEAWRPTTRVFAFDDGDMLFCCDMRRRRAAAPGPLEYGVAAE